MNTFKSSFLQFFNEREGRAFGVLGVYVNMKNRLNFLYFNGMELVKVHKQLFWLSVKNMVHNVLGGLLLASFVFPSLLSYFYLMREQSIPHEFLKWWNVCMAPVVIYFLLRAYRKKNMIMTAFLLMYFLFLVSNYIWV